MQNFIKKPIAVAVSASLLAVSGGVSAAAFTKVANSVQYAVATQAAGAGAIAAFYTPAGTAQQTTINILGVAAGAPASGGGAFTFNTGAVASATQGAAGDDVTVAYHPTGAATPTIIPVGQVGVVAAGDNIVVTLTPAGNGKLRANASTGKLEYTPDNGTTWGTVKVAMQVVAGSAIVQSAAATDTATPFMDVYVSETIAQNPTIKTYSVAGADKISGLTIDFKHALSPAPAATDIDLESVAVSAKVDKAGSITAVTAAGATLAAATGSTTAFDFKVTDMTKADWWTAADTATASDALSYSGVDFHTGVEGGATPMRLVFKAGKALTYSNVYASTTGLAVKIGAADTSPQKSYATNAAIAVPSDGAAPVLVSAAQNGDDLQLVVSEPMYVEPTVIGTVDSLREIAENVFLGTTAADQVSLAALALNKDLTLGLGGVTTSASNQSTVTITGVGEANLVGKKVTVKSGIAYQEPNDTNYPNLTQPALDLTAGSLVVYNTSVGLAGGLFSSSLDTEALTATDKAITAASIPLLFADAVGSVSTTGSNITGIVLKWEDSQIALNGTTTPAKAVADLEGKIIVTVYGDGNNDAIAPAGDDDTTNDFTGAPQRWQFVPTAAQMAVSTSADTLSITLPTNLLYQNINQPRGFVVQYLPSATTAQVMVKEGATAAQLAADAANVMAAGEAFVPVPRYLVALKAGNVLWTQSIKGTVTNAPNGSLIRAYVGKYFEGATLADVTTLSTTWPAGTSNPAGIAVTTAKISNGMSDNKVGNEVALSIDNVTTVRTDTNPNAPFNTVAYSSRQVLPDLIAKQLNKVAAGEKASPIPVYIYYTRSNDVTAPGGANTGNDSIWVNAKLYTDRELGLAANAAGGSGSMYEAMLDATSGKISGRIDGLLGITPTRYAKQPRGIGWMGMDGKFRPVRPLNGEILGQTTVDASGNYDLIIGIDNKADPVKLVPALKDSFVIMTLENPNTGEFTMLNSAVPNTDNYLDFKLTLFNTIAATETDNSKLRTNFNIDLNKIRGVDVAGGTNWQLLGFGNWASKAVLDAKMMSRFFLGIDAATGSLEQIWTDAPDGASNTGYFSDMALTMLGNKTGFAAEGATADTVAIAGAYKPEMFALALSNDKPNPGLVDLEMQILTKPVSGTVLLPAGWSLVSTHEWTNATTGAITLPSAVDAIINVGSQTSNTFTWIKGADGNTPPTLTGLESFFIYSKTGVK